MVGVLTPVSSRVGTCATSVVFKEEGGPEVCFGRASPFPLLSLVVVFYGVPINYSWCLPRGLP